MRFFRLAGVLFCSLFLSQAIAQVKIPGDYQYIFPGPGAKYVDPNSTIIIRLSNFSPSEITNLASCIKVVGVESSVQKGITFIASDKKTIIFEPDRSYIEGETVKVRIEPVFSVSGIEYIKPLEFEFSVLENTNNRGFIRDKEKVDKPQQSSAESKSGPVIMPNGVAVPADFPHVNVTNSINPSEDYIYLTSGTLPTYKVIYNTSGEPVWYRQTYDKWGDFTLQPNGWITMFINDVNGSNEDGFVAFDENFELIKSISAVNGYSTDEHDFYMFPDNGYILIGNKSTTVDMSQYVEGGMINVTVLESCIQEFTADGQLVYIWRAWDHFDIRDMELDSPLGSAIRFPHINAFWEDIDGNILISSRHLSEISKIDRQSGEFIWRLSGIPDSPNNDFQFIGDPYNGFRNQHAIQVSGNNRYTLFDNGNLHIEPRSRAVEYQLDTVAMTATMVWEYKNEIGDGYTNHLGNVQAMSNGNKHINWAYGGLYPIASEITPQGEKVFEMWFADEAQCYRSFRHPWNGKYKAPYLILDHNVYGATLIFNKFGDDNVDYYKIYGGLVPESTTLIDTSSTTLKFLTDLPSGSHYYFRVTAVDKQGIESEFSNEEHIVIVSIEPGGNLIKNGDFILGDENWELVLDNLATAEWNFDNDACNIEIQDGGNNFNNVSIQQFNIPLFQGQTYLLEYDAKADANRFIEIALINSNYPYKDYSRIGYSSLETGLKKYSYSFTMDDPSDFNARLIINIGKSSENIYIDNLSLTMEVPTGINSIIDTENQFSVFNYPNPFRSATTIKYYVPERSFVRLKIYNTFGQIVGNYLNLEQESGEYSKEICFNKLRPGIYYYSIEASALNSPAYYRLTKRMILLK